MPRVIANTLDSGACWFVARLVVTFVFWGAGIGHVADFKASAEELKSIGLEPAPLLNVLLVVTCLLGSGLILFDRWLWLGCGILSGFLVVAVFLGHPFWTMQEPARTQNFRVAVEHISLIGGLMALAIAGRLRELRRQ